MSDSIVIHDVSLTISESLTVWPGDPPVRITRPLHLDRGDSYTVSRLNISAHTGTHVDAPAHFFGDGESVDALDLHVLVGPAWVAEALNVDAVSAQTLQDLPIPAGTERLLLRTRNSVRLARGDSSFHEDFVAITADGAGWLAERRVRLVGVDCLSVGAFADPLPAHHVLLAAGIVVVEGLDLRNIVPGAYELVCLPLKIAGGDGAPARAILVKRETPGAPASSGTEAR